MPDEPATVDDPDLREPAAEMVARLRVLLGHLTARQREVLVLRIAVGLYSSVCSRPGANASTDLRMIDADNSQDEVAEGGCPSGSVVERATRVAKKRA